jgi:predicted ester cyclase
MDPSAHKAHVRRFEERVVTKKDLTAIDEFFNITWGEDFKQALADWYAGFPDLHIAEIGPQIAEGDLVASRIVAHGTHTGPWRGIPPTGKEASFAGVAIDRFEDGRIVDRWVAIDWLAVLDALGVRLTPGEQTPG